jgi:RNA polymerase sigma factor (TIGR02999 family)
MWIVLGPVASLPPRWGLAMFLERFPGVRPFRPSPLGYRRLPRWACRPPGSRWMLLFAFSLCPLCPLWLNLGMSFEGDSRATPVLQAAQAGDRQAAADLLPLVYDELRKLAAHKLAHQTPGQTLQPTALVHEAYLRVAGDSQVSWEGRRHFFFAAARAMRDILVEQARRKAGSMRGGDRRRQELDDACAVLKPPSEDVLAVHEALEELETRDPLKAQIVLLRYFTGLTMDETAAVLGIPARTLDRQWRYIRAWLMKRLG